MSDISQQQMDDLVASMKASAGSLGKLADNYNGGSSGKANAKKTLSKDLDYDKKSLKDHADSIQRVVKSSDDLQSKTSQLSRVFGEAVKGFAIGWVANEIIKYGTENVETYRELSKVGEGFGGSMIEMSRQAAAAGLPLKTFAEVIKSNSVIVNQLGTKTFFDMNKKLRDSIEAQGLYGYSLQELGDLQGQYMEQQRLAGKSIQFIGSPANQKNLQDFAANIVDMSDVMGTARDKIMENYQDATKSSLFYGTEQLNAARGMDQYNKAIQEAIVTMSAQPGIAGQMLSKGLADAFSLPGGANFSELGRDFIKAGQAGGVALLDEAKQRIANGEKQSTVIMETNNALKDMLSNPATIEALENQAQAGNESAEKILALGNSIKKYTQADQDAADKQRKTTATFTAFFESFESIFEELKGSFIDGFLTPFGNSSASFDAFWKGLDALKPTIQDLGAALGEWAKKFFTADNLKHVGEGIVMFIGAAKTLTQWATNTVRVLSGFFGAIHDGFEKLHKSLGDVGVLLVGFGAFFGAKGLMAIIGNFFRNLFMRAELMTVRANIVNVNGGSRGGVGDLGNFGSKAEKEAAATGKAGKAVRAAEEAEKVAAEAGKMGKFAKLTGFLGKIPMLGKVAGAVGGILTLGGLGQKLISGGGNILTKGLGKIGLEGAAKTVGRVGGMLIPGIGAAFDAKSAYDAHKQGNDVAAGLYGTGGVLNALGAASAATGIGVVATPFLDAAGFIASALGMAADFTGFGQAKGKKKITPTDPNNPDAATPAAGNTANPAASAPTPQPVVIDDVALAQLRTNAILGDQKSIDELKRITDSLNKQTSVLYTVQRKSLEEQRKASAAMAAQGGY